MAYGSLLGPYVVCHFYVRVGTVPHPSPHPTPRPEARRPHRPEAFVSSHLSTTPGVRRVLFTPLSTCRQLFPISLDCSGFLRDVLLETFLVALWFRTVSEFEHGERRNLE